MIKMIKQKDNASFIQRLATILVSLLFQAPSSSAESKAGDNPVEPCIQSQMSQEKTNVPIELAKMSYTASYALDSWTQDGFGCTQGQVARLPALEVNLLLAQTSDEFRAVWNEAPGEIKDIYTQASLEWLKAFFQVSPEGLYYLMQVSPEMASVLTKASAEKVQSLIESAPVEAYESLQWTPSRNVEAYLTKANPITLWFGIKIMTFEAYVVKHYYVPALQGNEDYKQIASQENGMSASTQGALQEFYKQASFEVAQVYGQASQEWVEAFKEASPEIAQILMNVSPEMAQVLINIPPENVRALLNSASIGAIQGLVGMNPKMAQITLLQAPLFIQKAAAHILGWSHYILQELRSDTPKILVIEPQDHEAKLSSTPSD